MSSTRTITFFTNGRIQSLFFTRCANSPATTWEMDRMLNWSRAYTAAFAANSGATRLSRRSETRSSVSVWFR